MFIYVNKDDLRSIELFNLFNKSDYYVSDNLKDIKYADIVYLGLRGIDCQCRLNCFDETYVIEEDVFKQLKERCLVVTIQYNQYLDELSQSYNFKYLCLNKNELFINENNLLSTEGLISFIIRKRHYSLLKSKILVFGNGHLGYTIEQLFNQLGIDISICARTYKNNKNFIQLQELDLNQYDIIINTIPDSIITHKMIDTIRNDSLLIDVSSFPYGLDHHYALSQSKNVYILSAIPSTYGYIEGALLINKIIEDEYYEN